jgi:hypothetical protein
VRRSALAAAAAVVVVVLAGCGYEQQDLFSVKRSGADRNANVTMVVNDGGTVTCNGGTSKALPGKQLLAARELARELEKEASLSIELPPAKNSILRYRVDTESGSVAFSDTSPGRPKAFDRLEAFTADVVENVCGIER